MTNDFINKTLGVEESYQMPERLMQILEDDQKREEVFDTFLNEETDLSYDWFTDYYQNEHGDREKLKQDFTPDCVCKILNSINGAFDTLADICAGTGGLTIKAWSENPNGFFHCEEIAKRAIPVLLFNMAIRGMNGEVVNGDVLTGEVFTVYSLRCTGKYSSVEKVKDVQNRRYDSVIMNPPYSLSWSGDPDPRFEKYGTPPKGKADYAFVLHGLNLMKDTGRLFAILPHGVLFRGQKEKDIRENLIRDNMIRTVIGLPDKLFLNTGIPVCIMEFRETQDGIYFIDASSECDKDGPRNVMRNQHIETVLGAYRIRRKIDRFSNVASYEDVEKNDFNLNIPRYVDTYVPEELPDLTELFQELIQLDIETAEMEKTFFEMMKQLIGTDEETEQELRKQEKLFQEYLEGKNGQMELKLC